MYGNQSERSSKEGWRKVKNREALKKMHVKVTIRIQKLNKNKKKPSKTRIICDVFVTCKSYIMMPRAARTNKELHLIKT